MELFLAADTPHLSQAMAVTCRIAHMSYRLGPEGQLLTAPLPPTLRGGLLMLSDEGGAWPKGPEALTEAIRRECLRRHFSGVVLDVGPEMPECFPAALEGALSACGRRLYLPETLAGHTKEGVALVCTALSGGSLRELLAEAVSRWGPGRTALDLQRLQMDFPLPCPTGEGRPLRREDLEALLPGRAVYFSGDLCARYFTHRQEGQVHFTLFDDGDTLRRKIRLGEELGIGTGFFMLPEVEDLLEKLF